MHSLTLASTLPQRLGEGALSSLMITFQRDGSQVLEETFLGFKTGRRLLERFTSQRGRERTYSYKFSKLNVCK